MLDWLRWYDSDQMNRHPWTLLRCRHSLLLSFGPRRFAAARAAVAVAAVVVAAPAVAAPVAAEVDSVGCLVVVVADGTGTVVYSNSGESQKLCSSGLSC